MTNQTQDRLTIDARANESQMRACARDWSSTYNGPLWSIGDGLTVEIRKHGLKCVGTIRDRYTGISARVVASKGSSAYVRLGEAISLMANTECGV